MKKILMVLGVFSGHSAAVAGVTLPVLTQDVNLLIVELNELLDDFVDGHLVIGKKRPSNPAESPLVKVSTPADSFIVKNFGDKNLSSLSSDDLPALLTDFARHYKASDNFYAEYQMWSAYVPTRYWELQFLAGLERDGMKSSVMYSAKTGRAANAFSLTYSNRFKPAYSKNGTSLKEPYKAQLTGMALEFSVTYAIARVALNEINNNLYA
jgi:hypothetical protein